jgi:hypothetical protein
MMPNRPTKKKKGTTPDRNKVSVEMFKLKGRAEAGIPMPILMPDGTDSGHTMTVRGIDSDTYRRGRAANSRRQAEILSMKPEEGLTDEEFRDQQQDLKHEADIDLLAKLVVDWSFPDEFSAEAVKSLLMESPFIANQVDVFACNRARFFGMPSKR